MTKTTTKPEILKPEILDELLAGMSSPEELMGDGGLFKQLKKAPMERVLGAELTHHLGYEKGDPAGQGSGNSRNGHSAKTVPAEDGEIDLAIPRDRAGATSTASSSRRQRSTHTRVSSPSTYALPEPDSRGTSPAMTVGLGVGGGVTRPTTARRWGRSR
jgi:hypothetical protein